jgi:hypothetical protein
MSSAAVIVFGILTWILISILLTLYLARVNRLNRPRASAVELSLARPVGEPVLRQEPTAQRADSATGKHRGQLSTVWCEYHARRFNTTPLSALTPIPVVRRRLARHIT